LVEEYSSGDLVCGDCGLVLGDRIIDTRSEWSTFSDDLGPDPSRVGAAADPLFEHSALETVISSKGSNQSLSKTHVKATKSKVYMTLKEDYAEIDVICDLMDLSKEFPI